MRFENIIFKNKCKLKTFTDKHTQTRCVSNVALPKKRTIVFSVLMYSVKKFLLNKQTLQSETKLILSSMSGIFQYWFIVKTP